MSIPQADLALRLPDVPKDREIVTVCASGMRSTRAAQFLRAIGYERVSNLQGGTTAWRESGLPVETEAERARA